MSYVKHNFQSGGTIYAADFNAMEDQIVINEENIASLNASLSSLIDDVHPFTISSFTIAPTSAEVGSVVSSVTVNYTISKIPNALYLDNVSQTPAKTGTINLTNQNITSTKTFTLKATDDKNPNGITKTAKLNFYYKLFYGAATIPNSINSTFVRGLSGNKLNSNYVTDFTVNAGYNQYIWFACPVSYCSTREPIFYFGANEVGFERSLVSVATGNPNETVSYYVYHSTEYNLGSTTISVK